MPEPVTSAQMRALENAAIDSGKVSGLELMERAGRGVVEAILETWPELAKLPRKAGVLCGPGNNGGDGFVVARLLKQRGWDVSVFLYGQADKLPPDARTNHDRWREIGAVLPACGKNMPQDSGPVDVLIDAVFGIGLTRPVEDPCLWEWFWLIDDAIDVAEIGQPDGTLEGLTRTVAIDVPSGLDADTGAVLGDMPDHGLRAPRVMLTVTFHAPKVGQLMGEGKEICGKLVVKGIGL